MFFPDDTHERPNLPSIHDAFRLRVKAHGSGLPELQQIASEKVKNSQIYGDLSRIIC